jgi:ubiquinone/menaquinone biosynthesis C-methylase UbiE
VAETDDRDTRRDMGMWPSHLSRPIREWYRACRGGRALDVGCGGGQFGLEPAYDGLRVVGIDVALGSLEIAHRHAREVGQRVDHVYADPAQPPFRDGAFDLLMGKDSLHHMPDVKVRLRRLSRLLKDDGRVLFYEHVGESPLVARVRNAFMRRLIPIIQRRCGDGEVSTVFNHGSVHEDVSRDTTLPALTAVFDVERVIGEMFFYYELEDLIYFASGKNASLSTFSFEAAYWFERLLLLFQKPDHVTVFGRKRA